MKEYQTLKRVCIVESEETSEDLLHDSFVTALEKGKANKPGFIYKTFENHKRTHFRDKSWLNHVKKRLAVISKDPPPPISGEAMDMMKAISVLTEAAKKHFSYRKVTKRVPAFIQIFLWKRPAEEVAAELKTSVKSAKNLCFDTTAKLKRRPELKIYMDIMDNKNFSNKTSSEQMNMTKRIRRRRLKNKKGA